MSRLSDKQPVFNRSALWSISLFSMALFVPLVLAKSLPPQPQPTKSAAKPSPQPTPNKLSPEREWHLGIVSQGLSPQSNPETAKSTTASKSPAPKSDTPQSQQSKSPAPKASTPQPQKSQQAKSAQSSSTIARQPSKSQSSTQAKAKSAKPSNPIASQSSQLQRPAPAKATSPSPLPPRNVPVVEMRVAIANGDSSLVVGSSTPAEVLDANGKPLGKLSANEGTYVAPNGPNIRVGKWDTSAGVWINPTNDGMVFVNDRWYRGDLMLVTQGDSLLAVNYVDLENYLVSVVGAEVSPSWPMDALKAQAIAARSYALVHRFRPANKLYDLGNTQRWQVYKGIESEWNTTRQAVQNTLGLFLSYKGGVVESMYAASDEIVVNVFGGRGMSQTGALKLAQQGYNYQQILGYYYPGSGLSWIEAHATDTD